jgi:hypothetical protein
VVNGLTGLPQTRSSPGSEDPGSPDNPRPLTKPTPSPAQEAEAVLIVRRYGDDARVARSGPCPRCGHELIAALRQIVTERREARQDGVLHGYGNGWRDGLLARAERRSAA